MREMDQVGTQEIRVLFPTLPQASCVTVASHTAFQRSPKQKGEKRASMISNSEPMVPEHRSSKELDPSCWMRASVTPTRCCLPWLRAVGVTPSLLPSSWKTPLQYSFNGFVSVPSHCTGQSLSGRGEAKDKQRLRGHHHEDRERFV